VRRSTTRRGLGLLGACAALLVLVAPVRADTVTDWNLNATNALIVGAAQPPQVSVPHLAMVHGAVYDAVNAIDGGHEAYLISSRLGQPSDSKQAAAATAAHRCACASRAGAAGDAGGAVRGLARRGARRAGQDPRDRRGRARRCGDDLGATARCRDVPVPVGSEAGVWRPVPPAFANDPNAWLKDLKPFLIEDPAQFRTKGPLALTSHRYAREFDEVKSLGSLTSAERTADQTHAARYGAENPPATWSRIFRTLSAQEGLTLAENARLYAMLYMTATDALISVWDDKAHWSFWADHGDPRGGQRRQPAHAATERLDAADRQPALSGAPVRAHRTQRLDRDAAAVLRDRHDRLDRYQQRGPDSEPLEPVAGDRRDRRRPRLVGHPLPYR
jgi:hypothetical protein